MPLTRTLRIAPNQVRPRHHRAFFAPGQLPTRLLRCKLYECVVASVLAPAAALQVRAPPLSLTLASTLTQSSTAL